VFRTIAAIALAIRIGHPDVSEDAATTYATALQAEAQRNDFDPLTGVAIIHRESRFHPRAISPDGEDYGLAQVRARHFGACAKDKDPVRHPSAACRAVKQRLLTPEENIRVMAELITMHRKICRQKTGHNGLQNWLASYQGSNSVKEGRWCTPSDGSQTVAEYREHLLRALGKHSKELALAARDEAARNAATAETTSPESSAEEKGKVSAAATAREIGHRNELADAR
jgi:hypothetical protein